MTRLDILNGRARSWWQDEPGRLERDLDDLAAAGFDLTWSPVGSGRLDGRLTAWPLDRAVPDGLDELLPTGGLLVQVEFGHGYPMVCPRVYAEDPKPPLERCTQHRWHVNGDGSLCLLQSADAWDPATRLSDVLRKAAAWRVEYALVETGVVEAMSLSGIVSNPERDHLVRDAADKQRTPDQPADLEAPEEQP
jgi:ubiquitin-protein ligase